MAARGRRVTYRTEAARTPEAGGGASRTHAASPWRRGRGRRETLETAGSREADVGPAGRGSAGRVRPLLLGLPEARGSVRLVRYEARSNRLQPEWLGFFGLESGGELDPELGL